MSNKDVLQALKSAIGKQMGSKAGASDPGPANAAVSRLRESASAPARSGRGVQFYLDDEDRKIIHALAAWFTAQDRRVSDSQVIKAAIRMAEAHQNSRLLEICDRVRSSDRRMRQRRASPNSE